MHVVSPRLTIIVPIFNEEKTVDTVLKELVEKPYAFPAQQVVVVDDGSTDETPALLRRWHGQPGFIFLRHQANRGKGAALRTALGHATGLVSVVQDADLEYDPSELRSLVEPILRGEREVVYGSRYLAATEPLAWTRFRLAVIVLNGLIRLMYRVRLTDMATCYKAMATALYRRLDLQADGFEVCAEVCAKLGRLGIAVHEVQISYRPRTKAEGKKITWRDGFSFARTLCLWRLRALAQASTGDLEAFAPSLACQPEWAQLASSGLNRVAVERFHLGASNDPYARG